MTGGPGVPRPRRSGRPTRGVAYRRSVGAGPRGVAWTARRSPRGHPPHRAARARRRLAPEPVARVVGGEVLETRGRPHRARAPGVSAGRTGTGAILSGAAPISHPDLLALLAPARAGPLEGAASSSSTPRPRPRRRDGDLRLPGGVGSVEPDARRGRAVLHARFRRGARPARRPRPAPGRRQRRWSPSTGRGSTCRCWRRASCSGAAVARRSPTSICSPRPGACGRPPSTTAAWPRSSATCSASTARTTSRGGRSRDRFFAYLRDRQPGPCGRYSPTTATTCCRSVALLGWFTEAPGRRAPGLRPAELAGLGRLWERVDAARAPPAIMRPSAAGLADRLPTGCDCASPGGRSAAPAGRARALCGRPHARRAFDPRPWEELAKFHEHRRRDVAAAHVLVRPLWTRAEHAGRRHGWSRRSPTVWPASSAVRPGE